MAHLFDPLLAVHTSLVEPLPHRITAVYEAMLPAPAAALPAGGRSGAGRTIMAGLLMKELLVRGDLRRCFVVCPSSLAKQLQDELGNRLHPPFEVHRRRLAGSGRQLGPGARPDHRPHGRAPATRSCKLCWRRRIASSTLWCATRRTSCPRTSTASTHSR